MNTFTFGTFKAVMDVSDINQEAYAFILRTVFEYAKTVHLIDFDNYTGPIAGTTTILSIPMDLQYAVFRHAKHIYDVQKLGTDNVASIKDAGGSTTSYRAPKMPSSVSSTYRMYSPTEPIIL